MEDEQDDAPTTQVMVKQLLQEFRAFRDEMTTFRIEIITRIDQLENRIDGNHIRMLREITSLREDFVDFKLRSRV